MTLKGKFIVVEGLEGAGKSTLISSLNEFLKQQNINTLTVREPGTTPVAEKIRALLKDPANHISPINETLLITAARVDLIEQKIKPALQAGTWVIGDRHYLSTCAYQGAQHPEMLATIAAIHKLAIGDFAPDLYLYLDIEPQLGLERAATRGALDRFEQRKVTFFENVRSIYLKLLPQYPTAHLIEANQSMQQVQDAAINIITQQLL